MSWLGDFAGGLLGDTLGGLIGGGINSAYAQQNAQKNMELQKELWKYMQSNKHQLEVQDLEAAGLNKILSATNGQAIGAPSVVGSADTSNTVNSAVSAKRQADIAEKEVEVRKTMADIEKTKADTDKARADAEILRMQTERDKMLEEVLNIRADTVLKQANTGKTLAQIEQIKSDIFNSYRLVTAQVDKLRSGVALDYAQISKLGAEVSNLKKQGVLMDLDINSFERKLRGKTAEQQLSMLETDYGSVLNQLGYSLGLVNPFSRFGASSSGNYGVGVSNSK